MVAREIITNAHEDMNDTLLVIDHGTGTSTLMVERTKGVDESTNIAMPLTYEARLALVKALNNVSLNCIDVYETPYMNDIEIRERGLVGTFGTREIAVNVALACAKAYDPNAQEIGNEVVAHVADGRTLVWTLVVAQKDGNA